MEVSIQLALIVAIYVGAAQPAEDATQVDIVDMSYVSTQRSTEETKCVVTVLLAI